VISGTAHPELAEAICKCLGADLCRTTVVRFSNENMLVQIDENVREADVFVIQPSCPPVSDGIIELLITIDALKHASAGRVTAVLPYFPYVRSDKKDRPRISITARLMADLLQTAGADRILTMHLHSPQVQGFFRIPTDQLEAAPILCDYLRESRDLSNYVLVAGDVGEDDKDEEDAETSGGDGEGIDRDQVADVVREERPMAYGRFSDPREGDLC
jgi:ribose-phosphate pyrophosphokinase